MTRIFSIVLLFLLASCSNDRTNRNPYLQEIGFRFEMNLNLPLYSPLTNTGNAVYVGAEGVGTAGIFAINTGFNQFRAFEASCTMHPMIVQLWYLMDKRLPVLVKITNTACSLDNC